MIPIFPLNLVLCPGEPLALHIFEPRYKEMVKMCIEEQRPFGVMLVLDNKLVSIGCTAQIIGVKKEYSDGRMDIETLGLQRFELLSVDRRKSYLQGTVFYFDDEHNNVDLTLKQDVIELHVKLLEMAGAVIVDEIYSLPKCSFLISHTAGLELQEKQNLLDMRNEDDRLNYLHRHFNQLIEKMTYYEEIKGIVRMNGHVRKFPPLDIDKIK